MYYFGYLTQEYAYAEIAGAKAVPNHNTLYLLVNAIPKMAAEETMPHPVI